MMAATRRPSPGVTLGVIVAVLAALAPLVLSPTNLTVYVLVGLAVIVTTGVSLLMGYAGQVSLGQAAFYAIGAYTAGLMATHGLPPLLGLACAPIFAGAIAAVVGIPILRLRGHYLAFATLAFQLILLAIVGQVSAFGGDIGLQGIPQLGVGSAELSTTQAYAWVTLAIVVVVVLLTNNLISSRPGRGLRALATSETAAESCGVPVARYRVAVFSLAAALAGLAGGVYAFFLGYVAPGSFPVLLSLQFVVMAVVGGLGTVWGAVVGSVVITALVQALNNLGTRPGMPAHAASIFSYAVYAILLIGVLLFLPRGLVPAVTDLTRRLVGRARPSTAAGTVQPEPEDRAVAVDR